MNNKIAIVTGSSSGFGMLSAVELACAGFIVIAAMRDVKKSAPLLELAKKKHAAENIRVSSLDVTSAESIEQFRSTLKELSSVDVLVNNAGFARGGFSEELTVDDYRSQFETNFFGVIAVTQAVLPFMRARKQGRIINVSSISGRIGFPGLSAYVSSKHALEGYSESLRLELKPFGIDVSLIEPGSYQTNIWSGMGQIKLRETSPYLPYMKTLINKIESGKADHGDPLEVAKLVASIAAQPAVPNLRYPVGKGVKKSILLKTLLPWKRLESAILKKLRP
ncbi:SDR family oxidoreductase [Bacillus benzoevorans]|uniref:NAD(P)-dependent dehydrogenase (Short-subunit alcohol dehydrogenase family) n=1 Tax=Bacillus benzoevorans TaxID=1456 RepID=A0A7X0HVJ0_9BACI|nr:SDR family oxidoreductase [Bacillus benzoevorans]MBB6447660.1 NAD(P)-dependent dehydrogenase (short-subunit alcohol dehydrogenase family) [Bacillus benzoevorans]